MRLAPPTPAAGTYPTGAAGLSRDWDGHAWAWHPQSDSSAAAFPKWHHRPWLVFAHPSFWLWFLSALASGGLAYLYTVTNSVAFVWVGAIIGCVGAAAALVIFLDRRVRFSEVVSWPEFVLWGALGGSIAIGISYVGEGALGGGMLSTASAGPFEESTKILIPVVLFLIGWYRDPRAGFAIALACGATFGILEGIEYIAMHPDMAIRGVRVNHPGDSDQEMKSVMVVAWATYRPTFELVHPLLVGFTAAIAWRWAAVRKHFWLPLLVAVVVAATLHSIIDVTISQHDGWTAVAMAIVILLYFVATKPAARELPGPDASRDNPPMWRPRIARALRHEAAQKAAAGATVAGATEAGATPAGSAPQ